MRWRQMNWQQCIECLRVVCTALFLVSPIVSSGASEAADCVSESEPNDTIDQSNTLKDTDCIIGQIGPGDQEILSLHLAEAAGLSFNLIGPPGADFRLDLFRILTGTSTPGGRVYQQGSGNPAELFLAAGDWVIGLSASGPAGPWRLDLAQAQIAVTTPSPLPASGAQSGFYENGDGANVALNIGPVEARKRWRIEADTTPGEIVSISIESDIGEELLATTRISEGPIILSGIGLDAGNYNIRIDGSPAGPAPWRLQMLPEGPRIPVKEDEPNDLFPSARALLPGKPVTAAITTDGDKDIWTFEVSTEIQDRYLSLDIEGEADVWRSLCVADESGVELQCRATPEHELADLSLPPGRYFAVVSGTAAPTSPYRVALRSGAVARPDYAAEPNDVDGHAFPFPEGLLAQGRFMGRETDRIALQVTGAPELWRFALAGGEVLRIFDANGVQLAIRQTFSLMDPEQEMVLEDLYLSAGRYVVAVEGADRGYTISARPTGALQAGAELEPNDSLITAHRLMPSIPRTGRIGDVNDTDVLRFTQWEDGPLRLEISVGEGTSIIARINGPGTAEEMVIGNDALILDREFLAGDFQIQLFDAGSGSAASWRALLERGDSFGTAPAQGPVLLAASPLQSIAAFWPQAQRVVVPVTLSNPTTAQVSVALEARSSLRTTTLGVNPASLTLGAGAEARTEVTMTFPPDMFTELGAPVVLRARDTEGRESRLRLSMSVDPDAAPVGSFPDVPPPLALRGGVNLASPGFGGRVAGLTARDAERVESDNPVRLFDGVVSPQGYSGPSPVRVEFATADPAPVAGFALSTQFWGSQPFEDGGEQNVTISLSLDGSTFSPVLDATLGRMPGERFFVLPEPIRARSAELRLSENPDENSLAEWKVIAVPGFPEGASLDIVQPVRGGHVVRIDPAPSVVPAELDRILTGALPTLTAEAFGATPGIVLGFADARQARISRLAWTDAPGNDAWGKLTLDAGASPAGPWQEIGRIDVAADGKRSFAPEMPVIARYLRFRGSAPVTGTVGFPMGIQVFEAPLSAEMASVAGEWGIGGALSGSDLLTVIEASEIEASPDQGPSPLPWSTWVAGLAVREMREDVWDFVAPTGVDHIEITLSGIPTVLTSLRLADETGRTLPLRRLSGQPGQRRVEAAVQPGAAYRIIVFELPRSVAVAVDVSGSLAPFWDAIRQGLGSMAETLNMGGLAINVIPLGGDFVSEDWIEDPVVFRRMLVGLSNLTTSSDVESTAIRASEALAARDGVRVLLQLTDGATSSFPDKQRMWNKFEDTDIMVLSAHIGGWDDPVRETHLLQDMAAVGPGFYSHLQTQAELDVTLDRAAAWIRRPARYRLRVSKSTTPPPAPGRLVVNAPFESAGAPVIAQGDEASNVAPEGQIGAPPSVMLVLDASGSMLKSLSGTRRIDIAKQVLDRLIRQTLPEGTPIGMRVFGDTVPGSCDTNIRAPLIPLQRDYLAGIAQGIEPVNLARTPIAASLQAVAGDFLATDGPRVVVLVTDGEETCDGDPESAIAALRSSGAEVTVNIVGFAIEDDALAATFQRWAETGGGKFYRAADGAELEGALADAVIETYRVRAGDGEIAAEGRVGDDGVELTAGLWRVEIGRDRIVYPAVQIAEGEIVSISLPRE